MRLLQRYILVQLLVVFAILLSVLTVLLVFVGVFREVSESGLGPAQALQILPFIVPSLMPFTIPATLLLTVCVVYGRLAGDQEVTAAKAAGINVLSLLWPSFVLGAVLSFFSLILCDQVIPWAVANIQRQVALAIEDILLDMLRTNYHYSDPDHGVSITVMGVEGKTLIMPTFRYTPRGHSPVTIQAQEASLEFDLDNQQVWLNLSQGNMHMSGGGSSTILFDRERQAFPLPGNMAKPKPRHMSIRLINRNVRAIRSRIEALQAQQDIETAVVLALGDFDQFFQGDSPSHSQQIAQESGQLARFVMEIHNRFALSCSCLFFVLLGGPFAILQGRRQFLTSFFLCFLPILLVYYPVVLLMMNLSKAGSVNPAYAMWTGNAILLVAAACVLHRVLKH